MKYFSKFKAIFKEVYLLGHFPPILKLMFTRRKILGYYGFLGDQNFGDELVFLAAKNLFAPNFLFPLKKRMPLLHHLFFIIFKHKFVGLVIGGGTLIGKKFRFYDLFFDMLTSGIPIYIHGTGVRERQIYHEGWELVLKKKTYGGIRGPLSKEKLQALNIGSCIVGDAAFTLLKQEHKLEKRCKSKNVLINLGAHQTFDGEANSRSEIKKFIEYLLIKGFQVQYLPFHEIDAQLGLNLKNSFPQIILLEIPDDYLKTLKLFQDSHFALGERLHFNVMASLAGCPFLSINYGDKHKDFLASLNISQFGFSPEFFSFEELVKAFSSENISHSAVFQRINEFKEIQEKEKDRFMAKINILKTQV